MKKVHALDEFGRNQAKERYGHMHRTATHPRSEHGHSHTDHNMAHKFETGPDVAPAVRPHTGPGVDDDGT